MSEKSQKKNSLQTELNFPMSSQEDSRVNRSRSRANKKERVTTDISGQRCFALSRHSNRGSWLARTCEELLTSKTAWSSKLCALTWKMKDTKSKRSIFQLQVSALPTEEKEFGSSQLWATPNTMDHLPTRSEEGTRKLMEGQRKGRTAPSNLREQVDEKTMQLWRTPTTMDSKEDSLKHATKLLQGKHLRATGSRIQITLADEVMVEEIKANPQLMEQYKNYEVDEEESSRATGVRGLHERTDISQGTIREDRDHKDDNRTLVQTRQSRVQSSERRGLGEDQTTLERNKIRQGTDYTSLDRVETGSEINVANANDEGLRTRIGGSDDDHAKESRSRGTDGGRSTSDDERHNTTSTTNETMDVANTESFRSRETRYSDQEKIGVKAAVQHNLTAAVEMWPTPTARDHKGQNSLKHIEEKPRHNSQLPNRLRQRELWWDFEPNVGRVAHGISGRVHRLKGLGNSIVPQIVEEIGKALIKGMKE